MPNDLRRWGLRRLPNLRALTLAMLTTLVVALSSVFKTRAALQLENVALRHQLGVLRRSVKKPKLTPLDRLLWAWLCGVWADWRCALIDVKPETDRFEAGISIVPPVNLKRSEKACADSIMCLP